MSAGSGDMRRSREAEVCVEEEVEDAHEGSRSLSKESAIVRRYIGKCIGEFHAMKMCEANRRNPRRSRSFVEGCERSSKCKLRENVVNLRISCRRYENVKICTQGLCRLITVSDAKE
jgi:hypothetical protein